MAVTIRKRSHYFDLAADSIKRIRDLNMLDTKDFSPIVEWFKRWYERYIEGSYVRLQGKIDDKEYLFIRMVNRFQPIYKRKIYNNLAYLKQIVFHHHLVLEVNPHRHMKYFSEWGFMLRAWAKLRAWIYKKYGKFDFLRIVELHKSCRPHFHILISGVQYLDYKKMKEFWFEKYGVGYFKANTVTRSFNACDYLLKYISKTICTAKTGFDRLTSAIFFAMNKRLFAVSRRLMSTFSLKIYRFGFWKYWKKEYNYRGSVKQGFLDLYCVAYGLETDQFFYRINYDYEQDLRASYNILFGIKDYG